MSTLLDIGTRLVVARHARRMSQRELGERVGVMQQQIARWEASGYRSAALERVDAVASVLGLDLADTHMSTLPFLAETSAQYCATPGSRKLPAAVRDLGQVAARVREHGRELEERFGIERVGVFGSFADGTQSERSDVDLLVDMKDSGGLRFIRAAEFMEDILGRKVDFLRPQGLAGHMQDMVYGSVVYVWAA